MPRNKIEAIAALMKKIGAIKPDKEPVTYDNLRRHQRLERRQRDGEMTRSVIAARIDRPSGERAILASAVWLSSASPLWEIAGPQHQRGLHGAVLGNAGAALATGRDAANSSASSSIPRELFLTGFVLALVVGMPLGMLLARVRALRIGIEPYIMITLRHADGGADPVHPVDDGLRLRAQGAGGVPVRGVSRCSTTRWKARAASSPN